MRGKASCRWRAASATTHRPAQRRVKTRWSCGAPSLAGRKSEVAARYDILRELGLLPLWRLRAVSADVPEARNAFTSSAAEATARYDAVASGRSREPPVDRVQHIAALEWPEFAAD